ncbi:hypothetical protein [Roseovarius sp. Pro17]|uniref:hypothetical protein n=1 Tax=Roseovarius sp. Pro17 TaxID=3108175 RepID=UPI002D780E32|nr:hypothetical protein [Roseovarius sp. Pro17]
MEAELGHTYDMGLLARPFNTVVAALHPLGAKAPADVRATIDAAAWVPELMKMTALATPVSSLPVVLKISDRNTVDLGCIGLSLGWFNLWGRALVGLHK